MSKAEKSLAVRATHQLENGADHSGSRNMATPEEAASLLDNRPEATALHKLGQLMNQSPRQAAQQALQARMDNGARMAAQRQRHPGLFGTAGDAASPNRTGLPDGLKAGIESLSGMSMDHVRVHRNSTRPAQLNALAYAQGSDIHLAPGQERHLPHEAWHVVQQAQGRVQPTMQMKDGVPVNDETGLEKEADLMGSRAMASASRSLARSGSQAEDAETSPMSRVRVSTSALQRRVALENAKDFKTWNGDALDDGSAELDDVIEELKDDFDWNQSLVGEFERLVSAPALYTFRDFDHMNDFLGGNQSDPPHVDNDEGAAMMMDELAKDFGSSFKGSHIPFSGSRVYAVGRPSIVGDPGIWATQNSATGYITSKQQSIVKNWVAETPAQVFLNRLTFPSNTKRTLDKVNLVRPSVMGSNAHAEVNQFVQLALLARSHGHNPEQLGMTMGSDIAHCAECYWAMSVMAKKGHGKFSSFTGCGNKLFARWREPWSGFYDSYGPNPFRNPDGSFKVNALTKKQFAPGTYSPQELNSASGLSIYK